MEPKYKVGDILQFNYYDGTVGTLRVDFIEYDEKAEEYLYCRGNESFYAGLLESDVIGTVQYDEEEYQLYLKLKEKYEHI
jgi:hypothetical protein